jgi:hypothetical protein
MNWNWTCEPAGCVTIPNLHLKLEEGYYYENVLHNITVQAHYVAFGKPHNSKSLGLPGLDNSMPA